MSHPTSRDERRHQRDRIIARRRFVHQIIWGRNDEQWYEHKPEYQKNWTPFNEWGRYAKWNMNCGCTMCHGAKYYKSAHKRREGRKNAESTADCRRRDKTEG